MFIRSIGAVFFPIALLFDVNTFTITTVELVNIIIAAIDLVTAVKTLISSITPRGTSSTWTRDLVTCARVWSLRGTVVLVLARDTVLDTITDQADLDTGAVTALKI